jgi:hypothetical protein
MLEGLGLAGPSLSVAATLSEHQVLRGDLELRHHFGQPRSGFRPKRRHILVVTGLLETGHGCGLGS